jgi:hypothetical protein
VHCLEERKIGMTVENGVGSCDRTIHPMYNKMDTSTSSRTISRLGYSFANLSPCESIMSFAATINATALRNFLQKVPQPTRFVLLHTFHHLQKT